MTSRILLLSLSLLLPAWQQVCAQLAPADDFFNGGAQFYISNNIPAALERVESGLKTHPDDVKLKKLEQLLKQQQQQSQQNQQQNKQQNQQDQSQQQKQDQQKKQQQQNQQPAKDNSKDPQNKTEQRQNQADQKKDDQQKKPDEQKSPAEKKDGEKQAKPDDEGQPVKAEQMTPEDAQRLLDAQKGNEQLLQLKPPEKLRNNARPVKDW